MSSFINGNIDVLVCTSIIESGIDVPMANSIIINNSHLFGLSQLYQMRGRVGRGRQQAYACLLIPRKISLSETAFRRIKTIEDNSALGSGYNVALEDMKIRGSGSLFGYEQSGGSGSVGHEIYSQLIQNAITSQAESGLPSMSESRVVFFVERTIPENYISNEEFRLSIYKNLSSAQNDDEINNIKYNLIDRFGPVPKPVINLINESYLKIMASSAGVISVVRMGCGVVCCFSDLGCGELVSSVINYVEKFFNKINIRVHFLPHKQGLLSLCAHLKDCEDSYSHLSRFFNKFNLVKNKN